MPLSRFTDLAKSDLREAFEYYERKKPELGMEFMARVKEAVDLIESNPEIYPIIIENVRRARVDRFPFGVWYVFDGETVIIACLHTSRNPKTVIDRKRILGTGV